MHKLIVLLLFGFLLTSCAMPQLQATAPIPTVTSLATATAAIPTSTVVPTETPSPTVDVVAVMKEAIAIKVGVLAAELALYPVEGSNGQEAIVFAVDRKRGQQYLVQGDSVLELKYGWNADQERLELNAVDSMGDPQFSVVNVASNGDVFVSRPDASGAVGEAELAGNLLDESGVGRTLAEMMGVPELTTEMEAEIRGGAYFKPKESGVWEIWSRDESYNYSINEEGVWQRIDRYEVLGAVKVSGSEYILIEPIKGKWLEEFSDPATLMWQQAEDGMWVLADTASGVAVETWDKEELERLDVHPGYRRIKNPAPITLFQAAGFFLGYEEQDIPLDGTNASGEKIHAGIISVFVPNQTGTGGKVLKGWFEDGIENPWIHYVDNLNTRAVNGGQNLINQLTSGRLIRLGLQDYEEMIDGSEDGFVGIKPFILYFKHM